MPMVFKYLSKRYMVALLFMVMTQAHGQGVAQSTFKTGAFIISQDSVNDDAFDRFDSIITFGKSYLGQSYGTQLPDGNKLDCSGFLKHIYAHQGFNLPRSTSSMASAVEKIDFKDIQKGDLMFFQGSNRQNDVIGHVSMVTAVFPESLEVMHSTNRGVVNETYNTNSYYTSRFLFAGRVLDEPNEPMLQANDSIVKELKTIKIIGVGDMMLGTNFPNSSYLPSNDGKDILGPVKEIISKGDLSFGNLEGVLLTGEGTVKRCSNPDVCYAFKMPDHYVHYFKEAGFNVLSMANNHVRDFGKIGTDNTIRLLTEAEIAYAGLESCPYTTFEKDGITFGFVAFSPNTGTIKINDYARAKEILAKLDSIVDIIIVSFHGGAEGSTKTHITRETEMFLGENRGNPYEFARMVIDAGADVVLGHGPHVTRAMDIYKDRFIAYSLGNFATYGRFNLSGSNGVSPIIELDIDTTGKFIKGQIHSTKQVGRGGPVLDPLNKVLKEIISLTKTDIPESTLVIHSDGSILNSME